MRNAELQSRQLMNLFSKLYKIFSCEKLVTLVIVISRKVYFTTKQQKRSGKFTVFRKVYPIASMTRLQVTQ